MPVLEGSVVELVAPEVKERLTKVHSENESLFFRCGFEELQKLFQRVSIETRVLSPWNDLSIELLSKSRSWVIRGRKDQRDQGSPVATP